MSRLASGAATMLLLHLGTGHLAVQDPQGEAVRCGVAEYVRTHAAVAVQ